MKNYKFKIKNLDCVACANNLEYTLKKINWIENVSLNFMSETLTFECLEENFELALKEIKKRIKKEEPDVVLKEE